MRCASRKPPSRCAGSRYEITLIKTLFIAAIYRTRRGSTRCGANSAGHHMARRLSESLSSKDLPPAFPHFTCFSSIFISSSYLEIYISEPHLQGHVLQFFTFELTPTSSRALFKTEAGLAQMAADGGRKSPSCSYLADAAAKDRPRPRGCTKPSVTTRRRSILGLFWSLFLWNWEKHGRMLLCLFHDIYEGKCNNYYNKLSG